ncbi:hypothetical protein C8Q70DRAFT_546807 [Cubamyces menziesii]|nr:hypothetical protein C8Q70DRAFT_546807 [Cubamyces menziesii]
MFRRSSHRLAIHVMHSSIYIHSFAVCLTCSLFCLHLSLCLPPLSAQRPLNVSFARKGPGLSACCPTVLHYIQRNVYATVVVAVAIIRVPSSLDAVGAGVRCVYCRWLSRVAKGCAHRACWLRLSSSGSSMYPVWCIPMMVIPVLSVDDMRLTTGR